jgi:phenylacetate-coenzyme A ligase PaaK-like adenylate-forming protein
VSGVSGREVIVMQDWKDIAQEAERIKRKYGL